ncbi:MAG: hypothetical protein A3E88_03835 [Legionellales bacterium RIFCSPHIGHO2_12_FULL_35_11]|nr:MAG: hypothetical protein A3E88_03835 [Legionellales bacterium RIFCSPHIGHO2_12_FULL_35_11]
MLWIASLRSQRQHFFLKRMPLHGLTAKVTDFIVILLLNTINMFIMFIEKFKAHGNMDAHGYFRINSEAIDA